MTGACTLNGKIPPIIHQTWKDTSLSAIKNKQLRAVALQSQSTWKAAHPEHAYMFWTDDTMDFFVREHYGWFYPAWKSFNVHIKRVDTARYCWLHYYGGIYADLDFICKKNVSPLLHGYEIVTYRPHKHRHHAFAGNAWMASAPGHRLWLDMLAYAQQYSRPWADDVNGVMDHTGPFGLGKVVEDYIRSHPDHKICIIGEQDIGNSSASEYAYHTRTGVWATRAVLLKTLYKARRLLRKLYHT